MIVQPINKEKKAVVFCFDNNYVPNFCATYLSLIKNTKKNLDVVILHSDIKDSNKNALLKMTPKNITLRFFNIDEYIKEFNIELKASEYWTGEIFFRMYIPFLFKNYKKVLYIDSDTIINNSIEPILNTSLNDYPIGACIDKTSYVLDHAPFEKNHFTNNLKLKNPKQYFNSGVILFNIPKIDLKEYKKRFIETSKIPQLVYPDQDILNLIFEKKVKFLKTKYNYISAKRFDDEFYLKSIEDEKYKKDYIQAQKNPTIIHYTTQRKPWNSKDGEYYEVFWHWARKTVFYEKILYDFMQSSIKLAKNHLDTMDRYKNLNEKIKTYDRILFWGASLFLEEFLNLYNIKSDNILGIIDKNEKKQGTKLHNYKIYPPEKIEELNPDTIILTVVNIDYDGRRKIRSSINSKYTYIEA